MSLTIKLYDLQSNELADLSRYALQRTLTVLHGAGGANSFQISALANKPVFTEIAGDGYRNLTKGNRKLIVWEDGGPGDQPVFHGRIQQIERVGSQDRNDVTITAFSPWMELGFDSEDRAGRVVRGSTRKPTAGSPYGHYDGNFISPKFASSVGGQSGISGPDLILQVLMNSQNTGSESDPSPGEGPLPITLTGTFDLEVPPAADLSVLLAMDWPVLCGDFITQLFQSGVCDFHLRPVDPSEGFDPYVMAELSAKSTWGSDLSGSVHFDFWTGSGNAQGCRHLEDFATVNNKLYDYLGPRLDPLHWRGNITPGSPGTTVDPSASRALYGTFMSLRIFDSIGMENASRPLYLALWNAEQAYRLYGRDLLWITAADGSAALFHPPQDFDHGDQVAINIGSKFGLELAEKQRVYGYTKTWTREDVPQVSQLLTSADV